MAWDRADLFLTAQDPVWSSVVTELRSARKQSHWIWFVFPQLTALGRSATARRYGIADLNEAAAYLANPRLQARLVEAVGLVLAHAGTDPAEILGAIDALKLRSCLTLFAAVADAPPVLTEALNRLYQGDMCRLTLREIGC